MMKIRSKSKDKQKTRLSTTLTGIVTLVTVLAIAMLSACGDGGGAGGGGGGAAGGATPTGANADFTRTYWRQPFPETVTVEIANRTMGHAIFPDGYDIFSTLWGERWLELFNVELVTDWVAEDYYLQMNLAIASGDVPDMFWVNSVQFSQLTEAGLVHDITDYINNYSSPALARMLEVESAVFETSFRDGRAFSIPRMHYGFITQTPYFWVRRDLYEQAGSPTINTLADLESLMDYFQNNIDTVEHVMSMHDGLYSFWGSTPIWHAHTRGGGTRMWLDDGQGGIISAYEQPELFDTITAWRDWYERGWVRPDFATTDWDAAISDIVSGRSVMEFNGNWRGWGLAPLTENFNEDSYMIALPRPSVDGRQTRIPIHFANYGHNVVRSGFAHPEILPILLSDYIYLLNEAALLGSMTDQEIGPFTINDMHHTSGPFWIAFPHYEDVVNVVEVLEAHGTDATPQFVSSYAVNFVNEILRWVDNRELDGLGRYVQMGHRNSSLGVGVHYQDTGAFLYTEAWGPSPQAVLDFGGITDSIIGEGITRIIMGLDPLDHWWVVLEDWRQAGGNAMTEAINYYFGG